jgi:hypothetical protein
MIRWSGALVVGLRIAAASGVGAEPITLDGLTFSDELGGVRLERGWGSGSLDDPFVLVEEITSDGPAILIVRGMSHRFGNRIRSHHEVGFALTKLVRNGTSQPWSLFNLELREFFDRESPFGDGLSFGQASGAGRPFRSDRFAEHLEIREPFDGVQFFDGLIAPGETVAMAVVVTDTTPRWEFYLLQKRDSPLAGSTGPAPGGNRRRAGARVTATRMSHARAARLEAPMGGMAVLHCRFQRQQHAAPSSNFGRTPAGAGLPCFRHCK